MAKVAATVADVKKWAMEHYKDGADVIIECWDDEDIQKFINAHKRDLFNALCRVCDVVVEERKAADFFSGGLTGYYPDADAPDDVPDADPLDDAGNDDQQD